MAPTSLRSANVPSSHSATITVSWMAQMQPGSSRVSSRRSKPSPTTPEPRLLRVERRGLMQYGAALELQQQLVEQRRAGDITDTLVLLEHPHVITLGTSAQR